MANLPQIFSFEQKQIRTVVDENGNAWFAVTDVCDILELTNSRQVLKRLDTDDVISNDTIDSMGRNQTINMVSESGLYQLIMASRKKEAKPFQKWVSHEVIPTIRKTGKYEVVPMSDDDVLAKAFQIMNIRMLSAEKKVEEQKVLLDEQKPIVENHKAFLSYAGLTSTKDAANTLGTTQHKLITHLIEKKFFNADRKPKQQYVKEGYFVLRPVELADGSIYYQPMVTSLGMDILTSLLKTKNNPDLPKGLL